MAFRLLSQRKVLSLSFRFQFCTRLAAVFAEEVGYFLFAFVNRHIQKCHSKKASSIHIRAFGD